MEWSPRDSTWLRLQIVHSPLHWGGSLLLYAGVWRFARLLMGANIMDSHVWAVFGLMAYATVAELNQHIIKQEQGVRLVDVVDAVMDWCSWVFFPMIVAGSGF